MIKIFLLRRDRELESSEFQEMMKLVSSDKRERILKFKRKEDAQMCLLADITMKKIISENYDIKYEFIQFAKGVNGKPRLKKPCQGIEFNYSHSGEYIAFALGETSVGIDVEKIREIDLDIAEKFFCKEEYEDLMKLTDGYKIGRFYELWTLKESYIKWDGRGLEIPLNSFGFQMDEEKIIIKSSEFDEKCHFKQYSMSEGYKLSVCSGEKEFSVLTIIDMEKLIKDLL